MKKTKHTFEPGRIALRVQRSSSGLGLFTKERIPKGACIIEYTGKKATQAQIRADRGKYLFYFNKKVTIDGSPRSNTARYINHSCAPNCEIEFYKERIFIFAKRAIKAGEELSYDYDIEYFDEHIRPYGCRCLKCASKRSPTTKK